MLPLPYGWLRPVLFTLDPERAHGFAHRWIRGMRARPPVPPHLEAALSVDAMGLNFPSPVGLAAGFDKGEVLGPGLFAMGFGFVEIGTITPRPQSGNPRPRLFRLRDQEALINRMGFNNAGAEETARRLSAWPLATRLGPIGINIGKNKKTPLENATDDYVSACKHLGQHADYIVVNVSSPNTPGLRELQEPKTLLALLQQVQEHTAGRPLLVKIDPDLTDAAVDQAVDVAIEAKCAGLIATNTTINHDQQTGGLSGKPLASRSLDVLRRAYTRAATKLVCIGVGGIDSPESAYERICAGATLVQIYTGMIYRGPGLMHDINRALPRLAKADGFDRVADAIGSKPGS